MSRPHIFVATHHKSGTVWMLTTFRRLASANKFQFYDLNATIKPWAKNPNKLEEFEALREKVEKKNDSPAVFVDYQSEFPDLSACIESRGARGMHIVRDPRDILLSAVRFHLSADDRFGGMTYQQKLASYETLEDRIRFEIDHNMGWVIRKMLRFDNQGVIRDVHYEDLIVDTDMTLWHELCVEFGLVGREIVNGLDAFWKSSVFGDMKKVVESGGTSHIKNAKPRQWQTLLSDTMIDEIETVFGEEIDGLGYPRANELAGV
tara:strand:+ start:814 stop:1599 length:786 start_codon:yes stop_codon:yes gene_type:complete